MGKVRKVQTKEWFCQYCVLPKIRNDPQILKGFFKAYLRYGDKKLSELLMSLKRV